MKKILLLACLVSVLGISCNHAGQKVIEGEYSYVPLNEYKANPIELESGTPLSLIAFSGGRANEGDIINLYQFLAVNDKTGDTVRILAPLISVETRGEQEATYTTPLAIKSDGKEMHVKYEPLNNNINLMLHVEDIVKNLPQDNGELDTAAMREHLSKLEMNTNRIKGKKYVVEVPNYPKFQNLKYGTAVGTLRFREKPW